MRLSGLFPIPCWAGGLTPGKSFVLRGQCRNPIDPFPPCLGLLGELDPTEHEASACWREPVEVFARVRLCLESDSQIVSRDTYFSGTRFLNVTSHTDSLCAWCFSNQARRACRDSTETRSKFSVLVNTTSPEFCSKLPTRLWRTAAIPLESPATSQEQPDPSQYNVTKSSERMTHESPLFLQ